MIMKQEYPSLNITPRKFSGCSLNFTGRLGRDPKEKSTIKSGEKILMADAQVAIRIGDYKNTKHADDVMWVSVIAWEEEAEKILTHKKGELISGYGRFYENIIKPRRGGEYPQKQVAAEVIFTWGANAHLADDYVEDEIPF